MELLRSKIIPHTLNYLYDEAALYLLVEHNGLHLMVLDLASFEITASHPVYVPVNHAVKWCVDRNCIYLPTLEGQILAIDKFSGKRLASTDLGSMMVASNLAQDTDYIYSLCGLPISNGIKINLQTYALCTTHKESGEKIRQSQCIEGENCSFLLNDYIWCTFGKQLVIFDKEFNKKATHTLSFTPWPPMESESFVFLSSASGSLEVFDKSSFQCVTRMIMPIHFRHQPIDIGSDCLCCMAKEGVYKVDLQKQTHKLLSNRSVDASLGAVEHNGVIFASNSTGICTNYRIANGGIDMIDIPKPCAQPFPFENRIILVSKESVYEIGA